MKQGWFIACSVQVHSWFTMIQHFSRKQVLEQGLCPVSRSFILALGHLWSFLLPISCLTNSNTDILAINIGINCIATGNSILCHWEVRQSGRDHSANNNNNQKETTSWVPYWERFTGNGWLKKSSFKKKIQRQSHWSRTQIRICCLEFCSPPRAGSEIRVRIHQGANLLLIFLPLMRVNGAARRNQKCLQYMQNSCIKLKGSGAQVM